MELGKKIRQLRFRAGFTQEQLADRLGIGAAFADRKESDGDLYQNANLALERAKVTEDHWSAC